MIEVARRVGVPLVGVGMPAHFLVRRRRRRRTRSTTRSTGPSDSIAAAPAALFEQVTSGQSAVDDDSYLDADVRTATS